MYAIDSMHGNELTTGIQLEVEARRIAQSHADRLGESVYLYEVGSDDEAEEIAPAWDPTGYVVFERMPDCHRASHRAARNWGRYPANGAERVLMLREDAEQAAADDEDHYDAIVRDAVESDRNEYEVAS